MRRLALVTLYGWLSGMQDGIPDSHPYRIKSTKCCINTDVTPDNGHIIGRNMYRKKNWALKWVYLQYLNISLLLRIQSPDKHMQICRPNWCTLYCVGWEWSIVSGCCRIQLWQCLSHTILFVCKTPNHWTNHITQTTLLNYSYRVLARSLPVKCY
jgi:hypothetical protein